jgi:hypothetical protein
MKKRQVRETARDGSSGSALTMVVLFTLMIGLAVAGLVELNRQESLMSIKTGRRNLAHQMALAGIDRAVWALKTTSDYWDAVVNNGSLPSYNGDVEFQDRIVTGTGGVYYIWISSITSDELLAVSTGGDRTGVEWRTIQAHIKRTQVTAPLHTYAIGTSTNALAATIHWGPIIAASQIVLNSVSLNQLYPQKFSATTITASSNTTGIACPGGSPYCDRVVSPDPPLSDPGGLEYWGYNNVPPVPTPDLNYYKALAISSSCPTGAGYAIADSSGTCFYSSAGGSGPVTFSNNADDKQPYVRYIEGRDCSIKNNAFLQGLIFVVGGNLTMTGNRTIVPAGCDGSHTASGGCNDYTTTPPSNAWQQYQVNTPAHYDDTGGRTADSASANEYPGDAGNHAVGNFQFGDPLCTTCDYYTGLSKLVAFKGVIYVTGALSGSAMHPQVIHGAVILPQGSTTGTGLFDIFYDSSTAIRTTTQGIYVSSMTEISAQ